MSTLVHAIEALRTIHVGGTYRPSDWYASYVEALNEFNTNVEEYIDGLLNRLDQAYNEDCRFGGWYPIPLEHPLLGIRRSHALQVNHDTIKASIESQKGFGKLREVAAVCGARFIISVRPNGVSITCNFLEKTADVIIQLT